MIGSAVSRTRTGRFEPGLAGLFSRQKLTPRPNARESNDGTGRKIIARVDYGGGLPKTPMKNSFGAGDLVTQRFRYFRDFSFSGGEALRGRERQARWELDIPLCSPSNSGHFGTPHSWPPLGPAERHGRASELRKSPDQRWAQNRYEIAEAIGTNGTKLTAMVHRTEWYLKFPWILTIWRATWRLTRKIKDQNRKKSRFFAKISRNRPLKVELSI